jgi:hypothetical protein
MYLQTHPRVLYRSSLSRVLDSEKTTGTVQEDVSMGI